MTFRPKKLRVESDGTSYGFKVLTPDGYDLAPYLAEIRLVLTRGRLTIQGELAAYEVEMPVMTAREGTEEAGRLPDRIRFNSDRLTGNPFTP